MKTDLIGRLALGAFVGCFVVMLVMVLGIVMLVRLEQSLNAELPILVTGRPLYVAGMTISVSVQVPIPVTE